MDDTKIIESVFTKEDFIDTAVPYEYVYQFHGNKFTERQMIEKVAAMAAAVGVRGFKTLYSQYLNELKQIHEPTMNYTQFDGQPFELMCNDWTANDMGVYRDTYMNGTENACPHPIMPIQRLINIDTGIEKMKIAFRKGNRWREIIVDKSVVSSATKIVSLSDNGISVTSENAKALVRFLSEVESANYDLIPEANSFSRLGYFQNEGFVPFVDGLIFDGDLNFRTIYNSIISHGKRDLWIDEIKKVREYSTVAKIAIAASLASVLVPICNAQVFFTHLWSSTSGTGKTVALMCAASIWGNPELGKYIQTFNSTQVGLERYAAFLNHLPLMIDEGQLDNGKFSVYQLSEGVGRTRGNKTGGIDRTPTWSNSVITTGETPLIKQSDGAGAYNRTLDIECKSSEKVIEDGQRTANIIKSNYGFAGREFVEYIYRPQLTEWIKEKFAENYRELCKSDTTEKQSMAAALVLTADEIFCKLILKTDDWLDIEDIAKHLATKQEVSVGERGYQFLCDWVGANQKRFATKDVAPENGEIYGIFGDNDGYVYIIRNIFMRETEKAGFNSKALLSYLKENKLISTRGKHLTKNKRINNSCVECVALELPHAYCEDDEVLDEDDFI